MWVPCSAHGHLGAAPQPTGGSCWLLVPSTGAPGIWGPLQASSPGFGCTAVASCQALLVTTSASLCRAGPPPLPAPPPPNSHAGVGPICHVEGTSIVPAHAASLRHGAPLNRPRMQWGARGQAGLDPLPCTPALHRQGAAPSQPCLRLELSGLDIPVQPLPLPALTPPPPPCLCRGVRPWLPSSHACWLPHHPQHLSHPEARSTCLYVCFLSLHLSGLRAL